MSAESSTSPTVALFGGTAGTGILLLSQYLAASPTSHINVFARTPSKLASIQAQYPQSFNIIQGDIRDNSAVKKCLIHDGYLVDTVISSIGMTINISGRGWTSWDPTICHDGTSAILAALEELEKDETILSPLSGRKTRLVVLSTTGISDLGRDIPIAMIPMYHWMLKLPHKDKKMMERTLEKKERDWVIVRPSLLVNGARRGLESLRTSVEGQGEAAIGYTVSRNDVAGWILEECLVGGEDRWRMWSGKKVTLTY